MLTDMIAFSIFMSNNMNRIVTVRVDGGKATSTIPNSVQVNEVADANRIQSNCSK